MRKPVNDGLILGSTLIENIKKNMTEAEIMEWKRLAKETSRMWRNFWVHILHNKGYSNSKIAKELSISRETVRLIIKGD